jgi:hypothetical protein
MGFILCQYYCKMEYTENTRLNFPTSIVHKITESEYMENIT